ncbi:hypothetical protein PIB30_037179 [Stylosanthes scabra]|uniref:Aminotransferase-like plant mobile domain-containing protein n=1 Tax=Stylosanthes scabra TaxID=79078 RepID=A0ABU6VGH7_9FABA|nr:hypothetical protein [Stylosanthes scabra]
MVLNDHIITYLEAAGLYQLAPLNNHWFKVDEPIDIHELAGWLPGLGMEIFRVLPYDANEETVMIYAWAYIMILLGTRLFKDKPGARLHIWWLPFVARLHELGNTAGDLRPLLGCIGAAGQ